jgi:Fic family protein
MADASQNWGKPLTFDCLYGWQATLFPTGYSGLHPIKVGSFRDAPISAMSGPYGKEKVHYEAPAAEILALEMNRFLEWFEHSRGNGADPLHEGLLRAGLAHLRFETLHPFEDGDGRAARALIDLALAQDGKQPMRLYGISRQLAKAQDE